MLFAELSAGDWLAIAGAVGGGIAAGGTALGTAIRFAFTKYAEMRAEDRKHELAVATQLAASTERIQTQAAEDNRKALEDGRNAFATLIEIQGTATKAVAALAGALDKLESAVQELRAEVTGKRTGKRRPRPAEDNA